MEPNINRANTFVGFQVQLASSCGFSDGCSNRLLTNAPGMEKSPHFDEHLSVTYWCHDRHGSLRATCPWIESASHGEDHPACHVLRRVGLQLYSFEPTEPYLNSQVCLFVLWRNLKLTCFQYYSSVSAHISRTTINAHREMLGFVDDTNVYLVTM